MTEDAVEAAIAKKLNSRRWRLNNLYWIENENGKKLKFRMNWAQEVFFAALWWLNVILKARQLGMSTFIMLLELDRCLFNKNQTCGIVDKTDEDAKKKLKRIEFAYDHLDDPDDPKTAPLGVKIKEAVSLITTNNHELSWSNGSKIWSGTSLRGGTVQFLWISELGYIAFHNPEKAAEIKAGALNTVHQGNIVVIESTHEGGKYGLNYEMIRIAQQAPEPAKMTPLDWRFHFYPWQKDPKYTLPLNGPLEIPTDLVTYFDDLEKKEGIRLTPEQKHWYVKKYRTQGDAMFKEFPSTPEEAVNAVVTGAIYGKHISKLRRQRRIVEFTHERVCPIYSFLDIGLSDYTAIWLIQMVARDILALRAYVNHGEPAAFYVNKLFEWEREYGQAIVKDYLPHDANVRDKGYGKSYVDAWKEAGRKNISVVPRTPDEWLGINHLRSLLPRFFFHVVHCDTEVKSADGLILPGGLASLEAFHTQTEETGGSVKEMPVHDGSSHAAAGLRTFAEAHMRGMLEGVSVTATETPSEERRERRAITGLSHQQQTQRRQRTYIR